MSITVAQQKENLQKEAELLEANKKKKEEELAEESLKRNVEGGNDLLDTAKSVLKKLVGIDQNGGGSPESQGEKKEKSSFGEITAEGLQHDIKMIMDFLQKLVEKLEERMVQDKQLEEEIKKDEKQGEDLKEKQQMLNDPGLKPKDPAPEASLTDEQKEKEEQRKEQEAADKKERGDEEKETKKAEETKQAEKPKEEEEEKKQGPRLGA